MNVPARLGSYRIEAPLQASGASATYAARHEGNQRPVVLQTLAGAAAPGDVLRLQREMGALWRLRHPCVVTVHEVGEGPPLWLAQERVESQALSDLVSQGGVTVKAAIKIGTRLASALEVLHGAGLVHRDLQPAKVLVDHAKRPLVVGFGFLKDDEVRAALLAAEAGGPLPSPAYWAPEELSLSGATRASDVYGWGATLYAILTGSPPFVGPSFSAVAEAVRSQTPRTLNELVPEVPGWLSGLVHRCLAKSPSERPTLAGIQASLQAHAASDSGALEPVGASAAAGGGLSPTATLPVWEELIQLAPEIESIGQGQLKFELETALESLWTWCAVISGISLIVAGVEAIEHGPNWIWVGASVAALLVSIFLVMSTDNYYVVDPKERALFYRFKFLGYESLRRVAGFDEFAGFTCRGKKHSSRYSTWWEYSLLGVLRTGKAIQLTGESKESRRRHNEVALRMAQLLDNEYWPGREEEAPRIVRDKATGAIRVEYGSSGVTAWLWLVGGLIAIAMIGFTLAVAMN